MTVEKDASPLLVVLIADIRGYTLFTAERGDEAAVELALRFAEQCENVAAQYRGRLVELRGDEALLVFASARDALRASTALQRLFVDARASEPSLPLHVGMGLDAGDLSPVRGGYRGGALNLAARLCSLAAAGEVFASDTVIGLARHTEGIQYVDRGLVTLKGLADAVHVFQVAPAGQRFGEVSPLPSNVVAFPSNLPDEPTPFIGRAREIEQIEGMLLDPGIRLVTLIGTGGTGKTRLARRVGASVLHRFPHGVYFVSLGAINDAGLVPYVIAAALELKEVTGQSIDDTLTAHLREKSCLLILDNFEHLLDAASMVTAFLERCMGVKFLITSRSLLHLSREHVVEVLPLSYPAPQHFRDVESLATYEAIALFVQQAQAAKAAFSLTGETAPAVAEICYLLEGLPLAIELAAARIRLFPAQALLGRLSSRLDVLTGGARDVPDRHQTLRGTIDWSYGLLTSQEQSLFARLSVFVGGCTLESAEAVCAGDGNTRIDVLEGMGSLVDKSLLRQDGNDEPRFTMLETIREYALERLEVREEADQMHQRHAAYFIALAEDAEAAMVGGRQQQVRIARLEQEHDNVRHAIRWLIRTADIAGALRLAGALYPFWNARGYWREGRKWLEEALSAGTAPAPIRAKALHAVGTIAGGRYRDYDYARALLEEALAVWRAVDDSTRTVLTLTSLANTAFQQGDSHWREFYEEGLERLWQVPEGAGRATILGNLALVAYHAGDQEQATRLFTDSLAGCRDLGEEFGAARATGWLARLALDRGELQQAEILAREGMELALRGHYMLPVMFCLEILATLFAQKGEVERAGRMYGAIETMQETTGGLLLPQVLAKRRPYVDAARAQIGEALWLRVWEEGRAMPLDLIAALARDDAAGSDPRR